ncbi:hypothetical protein B0E52_03665 [Rhodanobacter sp. C06]|uniref:hypothetical protein n=1 Tax=Rhodanobacter sp. C06 TaxID=1945854 RepID=UPI000984FF38|nr:hypothetical protein [Rhodanobacter sp. C06]OOG47486.1 hypothetical protein B0E52_03665 [Rhodanobacter sp. C06]
MFGWLAPHVAHLCPRADGVAVSRHWLRITPLQLARHLPAAGCVLYLPCAARVDETVPSLLVGRCELAPLLRVRWLVAASAIGSDGPHEWLECRARDGRLCARLHLLPDSDYLGWDALLAAGAPVPAACATRPDDARIAAARLLEFRCRRVAGIDLLDASPAADISTLGGGIARGIARVEGLVLGD